MASFLRERFSPFLVTTDHLPLLLAQYSPGGTLPAAFGLIAFANLADLAPPKHPPHAGNGGTKKTEARSERSTVF